MSRTSEKKSLNEVGVYCFWTKLDNEWCVKVPLGYDHLESKMHKLPGMGAWVEAASGKKSKVVLGSVATVVKGAPGCGACAICHVDQEATQKERTAYFATKKAVA